MPRATPTPAPTVITSAIETSGQALVLTNILSSPENYEKSGLNKPSTLNDNVGQDKAHDLEPNFSRSSTTAAAAANLVFASARRFAPSPSSNVSGAKASNPYGYSTTSGNQGTYDIWGTSSQDTTPPALFTQASGNQVYPVVAPGPQAPFSAPREYDAGLRAGGNVRLAVVIRDLESGLSTTRADKAVTATFYQAGTEQFFYSNSNVNGKISVRTALEGKPIAVPGFADLALQPYDDGPPSVGGNERQAGAVAGDGIYYCYASLPTPTQEGDFYIDIRVKDQADNDFLYDNIWGFSTKEFRNTSTSSRKVDLFVSDYTAGQLFPYVLSGDPRFVDMIPIESYWLTNPGGQASEVKDNKPVIIGVSEQDTFSNVNVWRTQCRGAIPQRVLDSYLGTKTLQINPNETKPGEDGPYTALTREVAIAKSAVIWAAPYAGTVFAGPGTITDSTTQANLTTFLSAGGRLFLSGRDIARSLSNENNASNDFLQDEMAANFSGETTSNILEAEEGDFLSRLTIYNRIYITEPTRANLQIPFNFVDNGTTSTYRDASENQDAYFTTLGNLMDSFTARSGSGITTTPSYTANGDLVGQRIEKVRANGLKSRAVFFSFGLEAVNRQYRNPTPANGTVALNSRKLVAQQILNYFKTGSISGTVTNSTTGLPIKNFLVQAVNADDPTDKYLDRTDENGVYTFDGLATGSYYVSPALLRNGVLVDAGTTATGTQTSPGGFFGSTRYIVNISGDVLVQPVDFQLTQLSAGTIRGRIRSSQGTPTNFSDDVLDNKVVGVPVLLRSIEDSSATENGGRFAALTETDTSGRFEFSGVPPQIELEVIVNPNIDDPTTPVDEADIPSESSLRRLYNAQGGPSLQLGRRILPDSRHPEKVIAPVGNTFVLNDPDPVKYPDPNQGPAAGSADTDTATDSGVPIVVPEGSPVSGTVQLNRKNFAGAQVFLLDSNKQPFNPERVTTTDANGNYTFNDVIVGSYYVRAIVNVAGVTLSPQAKPVAQNPRTSTSNVGAKANFSFFIAKVSGVVTNLEGRPVPKAIVKLRLPNDRPFDPQRQTTTNGLGQYTLEYVPAGDYRVRASLNGATGEVSITVSANSDTTDANITIFSRAVTGSVRRSVNGSTPAALSGVTVGLVNSAGAVASETTTGSDGNYRFETVNQGTYKIRATYQGQSQESGTFTVEANQASTTVPTIVFNVQSLAVTVNNAQGAAQAGANVSLVSQGNEVASGVTNSSGRLTFSEVVAGTYEVVATFNELRGKANVTVTSGRAASVTVTLAKDSSGATTYSGAGKIYYISIPYQDTNNPSTNNGANFSSPATTTVAAAFTEPPVAANGQVNYTLRRVNAQTGQQVALGNDSVIERGVGYILQVVNKGTNLVLPQDDPSRMGLRDSRYRNNYTVTLRLNPSARDQDDNGRNLIGFGFDPDLFSSVEWATATVTHPNGEKLSLPAAANRGWLENQITTSQYEGDTLKTFQVNELKPFMGYYVQTYVDGLKVTFNNPTQ